MKKIIFGNNHYIIKAKRKIKEINMKA